LVSDTPFKQQRLKAWQPILTPLWVVGIFIAIGAVFIPVGIACLAASNSVRFFLSSSHHAVFY
jgi:hypothetical protein